MAYGMLANSVEATKEASVQFAADARCVEVCLRRPRGGRRGHSRRGREVRQGRGQARAGVPGRAREERRHRAARGHGGDRRASRAAWADYRDAAGAGPGERSPWIPRQNKTAIREGRGLAALVNLLRRQRAASPLAASSLRNYEGEALRERARPGPGRPLPGRREEPGGGRPGGRRGALVRLLRDERATQMARLRRRAFATYRLATSPANWRVPVPKENFRDATHDWHTGARWARPALPRRWRPQSTTI